MKLIFKLTKTILEVFSVKHKICIFVGINHKICIFIGVNRCRCNIFHMPQICKKKVFYLFEISCIRGLNMPHFVK